VSYRPEILWVSYGPFIAARSNSYAERAFSAEKEWLVFDLLLGCALLLLCAWLVLERLRNRI
jgi:hypothetical protein